MKKKLFQAIFFSATTLSSFAFADVHSVAELQRRLENANQYNADFEQIVRSNKGVEIQKGDGKFFVKRPNLFRMETNTPQENTIISDGKALWFYDPFVEQVTVNGLEESVSSTPFVLLTSNDKSHWEKYDVTQNSDTFTLKPKSKSTIKQFDLRIDDKGVLKGFSVIEQDGQSNLYILRNISTATQPSSLFQFSAPKGTEIDDQRTKK
ncbi:outer membrane lipoprotein carrier protein [Nicoletella semolina]|uniref:Outer-membrane lipoprotein carrier protein n=1 Tax=Nicoletella semolina TaxID=271160 RepID=A0A4R2N8D5_9PAST|nr:outer membrane lipoprotein chaperone LolA [Nicoletella semolina]MDH2923865.1 outer-membrane lipoprotein carrier protein LolA [Nicoletella semolina]TCP17178.1 outer membrane lipoprotein carrier protein [Nicoletella semolina]